MPRLRDITSLSDYAKSPEFRGPIAYADVRACCEVKYDDHHGMPWEEHDGWEHELDRADDYPGGSDREVSRRGGTYLVVVDDSIRRENYEWHRARGASKQVAAELAADAVARSAKFIADAHNDGFQWYGIVCDPKDVEGIDPDDAAYAESSCWGIDDEAYAAGECADDVAGEVCHNLVKLGYRVEGVPAPMTKADQWKARRKHSPVASEQNRD